MDRRKFVKSGTLLTLPFILQSCDWPTSKKSYSVDVTSDATTGHLIYNSQNFTKGATLETEYLIVGGGIAGMTAACQLKDKDLLLCELSDKLGGSSSSVDFKGMSISQGAHYDLEYPKGYGKEVLEFLNQLNVIEYHSWSDSWSFKEHQHIVLHRRKNQCFDHGEFRKDVLQEGTQKDDFQQLLDQFSGEMHLPTRLIKNEIRQLNKISFLDFLNEKLVLNNAFIHGLDYHMKDDYGAGCKDVSALAGIHYFKCRPYYKEIVELFSPPEGNYYFIDKMAKKLKPEQILTNHLVKEIKEEEGGFSVEVIDVKSETIKTIKPKKLIYAGQKHALKYIYPEGHKLFAENTSSPWMVVNVVVDNTLPLPAFWQNEMITDDSSFMGFVDSGAQNSNQDKYRTLTAYYCLSVESRKDLLNVEADKYKIVESTIRHISDYFKEDIVDKVQKVFIKVMGHAIPIPGPGYLFNDKNQHRKNRNMVYAGVDNGRLPLFYEAVDSGLEAVKALG
ncbi:MAG: protoporphyrinogen oxidase [Cyclobacteriaceae bacterium]|jgi:protoporphyrinogen oxidase